MLLFLLLLLCDIVDIVDVDNDDDDDVCFCLFLCVDVYWCELLCIGRTKCLILLNMLFPIYVMMARLRSCSCLSPLGHSNEQAPLSIWF